MSNIVMLELLNEGSIGSSTANGRGISINYWTNDDSKVVYQTSFSPRVKPSG